MGRVEGPCGGRQKPLLRASQRAIHGALRPRWHSHPASDRVRWRPATEEKRRKATAVVPTEGRHSAQSRPRHGALPAPAFLFFLPWLTGTGAVRGRAVGLGGGVSRHGRRDARHAGCSFCRPPRSPAARPTHETRAGLQPRGAPPFADRLLQHVAQHEQPGHQRHRRMHLAPAPGACLQRGIPTQPRRPASDSSRACQPRQKKEKQEQVARCGVCCRGAECRPSAGTAVVVFSSFIPWLTPTESDTGRVEGPGGGVERQGWRSARHAGAVFAVPRMALPPGPTHELLQPPATRGCAVR